MGTLPTGRVTFLFSDIEGSTRHAQRLGDDAWSALLEAHDRIVDELVEGAAGVVVKHEGDGTFAVFPDAGAAVRTAIAIGRALAAGPRGPAQAEVGPPIRVRFGLHTGEGRLTSGGRDYVGIDVHYAARVAAAANGGQIVISDATRTAIADSEVEPEATVVDEGHRRLKDFDDPRPLARVVVPDVSDDGRPLRTLDLPTNLPALATSFVGRDVELERLARILAGTRLLTITGPGGTGKTRLAIGLADASRSRFAGGTWFVDLAPVRDPGLIVGTIAASMGVAEEPGTAILDTLLARLRVAPVLLVIDNLEQLLPTAATVVADLVRASGDLTCIVTSREILRVSGEHEYLVPPLDDDAGTALFLDRARARGSDPLATADGERMVRAIVARLEGLPLAIELAAARSRLMTPAAILERLERSLDLLSGGARDLPERQRTLRAALAWSHDLLEADEQTVFRRLAVFGGGWTLDAAEAVVDHGGADELDVSVAMESMVDRSLLRVAPTEHGEPRFGCHVLIREYAAERLDEAGERDACEERHALAFLDLAERAGPELVGMDAAVWLDRLEHEEHNLRNAMTWSLTRGDLAVGARIAGAAWRFWQLRTRLTEGLGWTDRLLADPRSATLPTPVRVGLLSADGGLAYWSSSFERTRRRYIERLDLARAHGDPRLLAEAHYEIGFLGMLDRDPEMLREHETAALALFEQVGDTGGQVRARQALVLLRFLEGDYRGALELESLNLAEFERMGAAYQISDSLMLHAVGWTLAGDLARGRAFLRRSMRLASGVTTDAIAGLTVAAHIALRSDEPEVGARLAGAAAAISAATSTTNAALSVLHLPDAADAAREVLGEEAAAARIAEGAQLTMEEALALAHTVMAAGDEAAPD
ncbi:MAG: ATP-binding protein [Candidatus Limnocylindria bacterium]